MSRCTQERISMSISILMFLKIGWWFRHIAVHKNLPTVHRDLDGGHVAQLNQWERDIIVRGKIN